MGFKGRGFSRVGKFALLFSQRNYLNSRNNNNRKKKKKGFILIMYADEFPVLPSFFLSSFALIPSFLLFFNFFFSLLLSVSISETETEVNAPV